MLTEQAPRIHPIHKDPTIVEKIVELVALAGQDPAALKGEIISQMMATALKMGDDDINVGQFKLMLRSFKEMRHAYRIFNTYRTGRCVSLFGSARTPPEHPDYIAARAFSEAMASRGWSCMTGAANGIMQAGLEGAGEGKSFGLSIRLPFENSDHTLLADDPRLISFRYFFVRKLMFLSHSDALAAFPGGVGTQDELFEALTLMQTGRSNIIPIVLIEGEGTHYWEAWENYLKHCILARGLISAEDQHLYYRAPSIEAAVSHIEQFYRRYHSSRYVGDLLVIRLLAPLTCQQIASLNEEFRPLIEKGDIFSTAALPEEDDALDLPRIAFIHTCKHFGLLRALIDRVNAF